MCAAKLKEALKDCLINFDSRVLLTDLINDYHMPIEEVSSTLIDFCKEQEKDGVKYEKRYVVHGTEAENPKKQIFKIVKGDAKLSEWLSKLKNSESSLYSVEIAGGSKSPAEDLKPVKWCAVKLDNLQERTISSKQANGDANKALNEKAELKEEVKAEAKKAKGIAGSFAKAKSSDTGSAEAKHIEKATTSAHAKESPGKKKSSPQGEKIKKEDGVSKASPQKSADTKKTSPKDKKAVAAAAAAVGQKSIGNFFAPKGKGAADATKKTADSGVTRQKSPKKLNDFFKKQAEKPASSKEAIKREEKTSNTSIQLFDDEEDEEEKKPEQKEVKEKKGKEEKPMEVSDESSDEEEELNKLRRKVADADEDEAAASSRKRLRIEDSDEDESDGAEDEQQPQQKQGKLDEAAEVEVVDSPPKSETYLDEDGFVITVKSKKPQQKPAAKANSRLKTPTKTSPKANTKSKQTPTPSSKTKQGNIMNFFKKK